MGFRCSDFPQQTNPVFQGPPWAFPWGLPGDQGAAIEEQPRGLRSRHEPRRSDSQVPAIEQKEIGK